MDNIKQETSLVYHHYYRKSDIGLPSTSPEYRKEYYRINAKYIQEHRRLMADYKKKGIIYNKKRGRPSLWKTEMPDIEILKSKKGKFNIVFS